jgi:Coenzyme PQQ synthesis protein D (PqqD)
MLTWLRKENLYDGQDEGSPGTMDQRYDINHSAVASEVINGEAIMLHHLSGDYFSADGIGAIVWQWISEARSHEQIVRALEVSFPHSSGGIAAAVDAFLADLLRHELIREIDSGEGPAPGAPPQQATNLGGAFVPPILNVYSDMRDVLLLDPIHEVEEMSGWPVPKRPHAKP